MNSECCNILRQIGQLLVRMGEWDYLHELTRDQGDPVAAAVFAVTVAEEAAKRNQLAEAKQWTSVALAASVRSEAGAYRPYLGGWVVAMAASFGALTEEDGLLQSCLAQARQLGSSRDKSVALGQIAVAMAQVGNRTEARAVLAGIADTEERDTTAEVVAKAWTRAGDSEGATAILAAYEDTEGLERYSVISGIAEGLAEGRQLGLVSRFDEHLSGPERAEMRVIAAETLRKSGVTAGRDELLDQARELGRSASGDEYEAVSRAVVEMLEEGRVDAAVATANEMPDPHSKAFALLAIAKKKLEQEHLAEMRELLERAAQTEEKEPQPDLRAAGYREIGRVFVRAGDKQAAMRLFERAMAEATQGGEYGSDTVADVAEEYARLGELRLARLAADRYCVADDRLGVYTAILRASRGARVARTE